MLVFDFEPESALPAGTSTQVLAGKAEKEKRREIALSAFCVNWRGAFSPLRFEIAPATKTWVERQKRDSEMAANDRICHAVWSKKSAERQLMATMET